MRDGSLEQALRLGCAAGGIRVTLLSGSDNAPTLDELNAFLDKQLGARHDSKSSESCDAIV